GRPPPPTPPPARARPPAAYGGKPGNGTTPTATPLTFLSNPDGSLGVQANGDITTNADVDVYRVQAPLNVGSMNVTLHVAGLSLLTARLTVYDSSGHVVGSAVATDPLHNELTVRVSSPVPLGTYYVQVASAS